MKNVLNFKTILRIVGSLSHWLCAIALAAVIGFSMTVCDTGGGGGNSGSSPSAAKQFSDYFNTLYPGSVAVVEGGYVATLKDLTLTSNLSVPSGVILIVSEGKKLTVESGNTLELTDGSLVLENDATLTVNGTVNAKACQSESSFGIAIMPESLSSSPSPAATINGNGIIHLTTRGNLLVVMVGQKLTISGDVMLDGLTTETTYPGTTISYPAGIGDDPINNAHSLVHVEGELDMRGGTIIGNYNATTGYGPDGGGVEVNKEDGGSASFTMSGTAKVSGNRAGMEGGGVNVCMGGRFIMEDYAEVSGNMAAYAGGVRVASYNGYPTSIFTMNGGTIYGSDKADSVANKADSSSSASLGIPNNGTAKYGNGDPIISGYSGSTNDTLMGH